MSGPRKAEDRLRRLLVMLPWLMEVGEVPLSDVSERFDMTAAEVQKELELVAMCGLPPFVDEMIDVFVDDGIVFVGVPRLFTRPLRLTAPEGFSLLSSARAAMELPGADPAGPLGRGLAKLAAALGDAGLGSDLDDTAGVVIDLARPELTDELVEASASGAEMTIRYYSPARDELTDRTIVPHHVFADAGNWYVHADDALSQERRTFRIDRVEGLELTGRTFPPVAPIEPPERFFGDSDVPRVVLRLAPGAQWVVERYPTDDVRPLDDPPGWVEAKLPLANERWLSRLLIRLGPDVVLVEPESAQNEAALIALEILSLYTT
jgi:proteasome accessory factor C